MPQSPVARPEQPQELTGGRGRVRDSGATLDIIQSGTFTYLVNIFLEVLSSAGKGTETLPTIVFKENFNGEIYKVFASFLRVYLLLGKKVVLLGKFSISKNYLAV